MSTRTTPHRFALEQMLEVQDDKYPSVVQVVALVPGDHRCAKHDALFYGCVHSGDHFTLCEELLKPLSPANRRKMN
jgi:hypothetical protein